MTWMRVGDHAFGCTGNSKIMAHHFIYNGWALALQRVIATAGYILPAAKLKTEMHHLLYYNLGANPLDLSFNIVLRPSPAAPATCEYACIGGNITITPLVEPFDISGSVNIIESITTAADEHLQKNQKFLNAPLASLGLCINR